MKRASCVSIASFAAVVTAACLAYIYSQLQAIPQRETHEGYVQAFYGTLCAGLLLCCLLLYVWHLSTV